VARKKKNEKAEALKEAEALDAALDEAVEEAEALKEALKEAVEEAEALKEAALPTMQELLTLVGQLTAELPEETSEQRHHKQRIQLRLKQAASEYAAHTMALLT